MGSGTRQEFRSETRTDKNLVGHRCGSNLQRFIGTIGVLVIGVFIAFITLGGLEGGLGDDGDFGDCD